MFKRSHRVVPKDKTDITEFALAVERLVEEFKPEAVYLFGSAAEGKRRPESSVDILVISNHVGTMRFLDRIKKAIRVTEPVLTSVTPLVYTPKEIELLQQQGDGFLSDIMKNAVTLYERKKG
jgi:predicted nucleotidyltransferase